MSDTTPLTGTLHAYVAFDWGDEILLDEAGRLVSAESLALSRRRRTPPSFEYSPPPLRVPLPAVSLKVPEVGKVEASAAATLFDFGAVSVELSFPFTLPPEGLLRLAAALAEPASFLAAARAAVRPLHERLSSAIKDPEWNEGFSEEFFVFRLPPGPPLPAPAELLAEAPGGRAAWLAGLVRLEGGPLSEDEVAEALRLRLRYSPEDLFVPDWAAAVLIDRDCEETLQVIEFANLQLLEFRHIDTRLDTSLGAASRLLQPRPRSWVPFWRYFGRPLRKLGEMKVEANELFEKAGNALKLVGDQYLARVYRLVGARFHVETWEESIRRRLEAAEGAYQVLSDQASGVRQEFMELIIILLILFEVIMAFVRH
jgi:hypothetical protein